MSYPEHIERELQMSMSQSERSRYSEQGEAYDADLIADLEAKAKAWKGRPIGYLLAEAAERLKVLSPSVAPPPNVLRDPSRMP